MFKFLVVSEINIILLNKTSNKLEIILTENSTQHPEVKASPKAFTNIPATIKHQYKDKFLNIYFKASVFDFYVIPSNK